MKVIKPTIINDTILSSSSVPENDYAEWNAATNYTVGTKVIRLTTHRIYESLTGGIDATLPENATAGPTPKWLDIGPTNRWAMFDQVVGTKTTATGSLSVSLDFPNGISGLALLELQGSQLVVEMIVDSVAVYSKTVSLDGTSITSFYDWFFTEYEQLPDIVMLDLPQHFHTPTVNITITGTGTVSCGVCVIGQVSQIGDTDYGASVEIDDYSKKERDEFGRYAVVERAFSKRTNQRITTNKEDFSKIFRILSSLRAVPCVYVATEEQGYSSLIVYGFFRNFEIEVSYPTINYCSLEIEGMI